VSFWLSGIVAIPSVPPYRPGKLTRHRAGVPRGGTGAGTKSKPKRYLRTITFKCKSAALPIGAIAPGMIAAGAIPTGGKFANPLSSLR
jgi:hypothetical protein